MAAPTPKPTDKPTEAPKADTAPQEPKQQAMQFTSEPKPAPAGVPDALARLMETHNVAPIEIQAVVAQKGYYPVSTPISKYDPAFVQGVLIGAWAQVEGMILAERKAQPF